MVFNPENLNPDCLPNLNESQLHKRSVAENLLDNPPHFPAIDPETLPIAGLKSFEHQGNLIYPQEILPPADQPFIILDLDDTVWPQVKYLIRAISEASGVPVSMEDFRPIGHTRKIPQWQTPEITDIHDQMEIGNHPDFLPHVSHAFPEAILTINALKQMGHQFSYLTSRSPELFSITYKVLQLNQLPVSPMNEPINPLSHSYPHYQLLYNSDKNFPSGTDYKYEVVTQWLQNLKANGWQGQMVVIDDLLKAFQSHIDSENIIGISLNGPLNEHTQPYNKEIRLDSWTQISQIIMSLHQRTLENSSSPDRIFSLDEASPNTILVVSKNQAGCNHFNLCQTPHQLVDKNNWLADHPEFIQPLSQ